MEDLLQTFDAWKDVVEKARKAKGLAKWERLSHIAEKLEGKKASDITFTTSYPGQEGKKKVLGSVEGNLHFLLGYGNPAFHFAPYHHQIMDPNLSEEEAEELYKLRGHPSRLELWEKSELEMKDEGDLVDGQPHLSVPDIKKDKEEKKKKDAEKVHARSGIGSYVGIPSEGLVYGEHNNHVYSWSMMKDSFFSAANPEFANAMNAFEEDQDEEETQKSCSIPDFVTYFMGEERSFSSEVYPLVKSLFPPPGSVVPVPSHTDETVYGVVGEESITWFEKSGNVANVRIYDRDYSSFDLRKGGDLHPSILYNFAFNHLGVSREEVEQYIGAEDQSESSVVAKGTPTPGIEDVEEEDLDSLEKSVEVVGNTYRLVFREKI